jgi:peptide/nickel transport system substrate-binding protein
MGGALALAAMALAPGVRAAGVKEGGQLVATISSDMVAADPALSSDGSTFYVSNQAVEGLVGLKPGTIAGIVPVLATEMPTISDDGLTYTFKLHTGVKFHDGTDFNADAVKYNYMRQRNLPEKLRDTYDFYYGNVFGGWGDKSNITAIDTPDQQTVVFHLKRPQSNFLISQTLVVFGIQSPTALKAGDADNPDPSQSKYYTGQGSGMVGTGPFKLAEWVPNDHITLVKNPNYWNPSQAAHLDTLIFKPMPDQTAALNALQAGDIDVAQLVSPHFVNVVKGDPNLQLIQRGEACNTAEIGMTLTHAPVDNKDIRFAIAYAINKPAYLKTFYSGLGQVADNWMPLNVQYAIPLNLPGYDPDKARDYIKKSGLTGDQLKLQLWYPSDFSRPYMPDAKGLFEAVSRDLTAVGFTVEPNTKSVPNGGYFKDVLAGLLPAYMHGWTCDWGGADNFLQAWLDAGANQPQFAYKNQEVADAVNQALAATSTEQAKTAWEKVQRGLAADMPTVPLVHAAPQGATRTYVHGLVGAGNLVELYNSVWIDK